MTDREHQQNQATSFRALHSGPEILLLPNVWDVASARLIESNIKSLLRLVHDVESALLTHKRLLATESGENFAERLLFGGRNLEGEFLFQDVLRSLADGDQRQPEQRGSSVAPGGRGGVR